jgi:hypothetical protein
MNFHITVKISSIETTLGFLETKIISGLEEQLNVLLEDHNQIQLKELDRNAEHHLMRQVLEQWNTYIGRFYQLLNGEFHRHDR